MRECVQRQLCVRLCGHAATVICVCECVVMHRHLCVRESEQVIRAPVVKTSEDVRQPTVVTRHTNYFLRDLRVTAERSILQRRGSV